LVVLAVLAVDKESLHPLLPSHKKNKRQDWFPVEPPESPFDLETSTWNHIVFISTSNEKGMRQNRNMDCHVNDWSSWKPMPWRAKRSRQSFSQHGWHSILTTCWTLVYATQKKGLSHGSFGVTQRIATKGQ
jgi:hypothetical protein